jgi:hypothetical protein
MYCPPPNQQEQEKKVDSTFTNLDQNRSQGLEATKQLQTTQNAALEQEQKRLTAKYGADHPRVQKASARLTYNQGLFRDLDAEIERTKIQVPTVDLNSWLGHGFVLDKQENGIAGLTVSFFNANGEPIRQLGFACTDAKGYFAITYVQKTPEETKILASQPLYLTVSDPNQRILHRETSPRTLQLGQIEFWRVILGAPPPTCPAPPSTPGTPTTTTGVVFGTVTNPQGEGLPKLKVTVFDAKQSQPLGSEGTSRSGTFKISYTRQITATGTEIGPDLYVTVTDARDTLLSTSRDNLRKNAKREEEYKIVLERTIDRPPG